jgi:hypothetical protein
MFRELGPLLPDELGSGELGVGSGVELGVGSGVAEAGPIAEAEGTTPLADWEPPTLVPQSGQK